MFYKQIIRFTIPGFILFGVFLLGTVAVFSQEKVEDTTKKTAADSKIDEVVVIRPLKNKMKYETTEFTVKSGMRIKLIMDNIATSGAMVHNVVILKTDANVHEIGIAAIKAGASTEYIPEHDGVLFATPIANPGEKTVVTFIVPPPGDYPYICTFPGHFMLMNGVMHAVE